jgi:actin-related protein 3
MEENGDKKENEESKENLETKEESENEKESKENKNKDEENNIIIEQNKDKDKEINIQEKEKDDSEDKNEIIIENKEQQKENNKEEIKENDEIKINIINEEKNDKSEIKNKILSEKSIEEIIDKDNDQIINIEEKENSEEDEPEYSKNDIEALYLRTKSNKSMKLEQFYEQKRHYFIMTEGGTPIYSRYGDEIQNCSLLATFSAIITKFTIFNNEKNSQEKLNYICNDNSIIAFLKKGKIVFIALSNKTDSLSFLYSQLELLYQQLLSIVTSERMPILEEKPSSCSTVLSGINESMEQMIEYSSNTLVGLLSSYQVLPIENRQRLNNICHKYLKNALICCLMTPDAKQIISLSKSNIINLSFNDIILIQCLIMSSDSLRSGESWVPICLPGISSEGFLQLYCNFVTTDKFGIIFVTESQEQKYFNDFVNLSRKIYNEIEEQKYLKNIENSLKKNEIKKEISEKNEVSKIKDFIEGTIGVKEVIDKKEKEKNIRIQIHKNIIPKKVSIYYGVYNPDNDFIKDPLIKLKYGLVRNKLIGQFFTINFSNNDEISPNEKYIYSKYIKLHDMFISMNTTTVDVDNYFHIEKDNKYTHGIYVTDTYAIFGTFNLFKSNEEVHGLLKEIAKLIKSHDSNFFINFK